MQAHVNIKKKSVKKRYLFLFTLLCCLIFIISMPFICKENRSQGADLFQITEQEENSTPLYSNIPTVIGKKGTESNPFVVLEIVPFKELQQVGYYVSGSEPIDINNKLDTTYYGNEGMQGEVPYNDKTTYTWCPYNSKEAIQIKDVHDIKKDITEFAEKYKEVTGVELKTKEASQLNGWVEIKKTPITKDTLGYYEKTEYGKGKWNLNQTSYYPIEEFGFESSGWANWNFIPCEERPDEAIDYQVDTTNELHQTNQLPNGTKIWYPQKEVVDTVYTYARGIYKNLDRFKQEIFFWDKKHDKLLENAAVDAENFHMKVIAVTPQDLLKASQEDTIETMDYIERADLIYVNNGIQQSSILKLYNQYGKDKNDIVIPYPVIGKELGDYQSKASFSYTYDSYDAETGKRGNIISNDIPWTSVMKILQREGNSENFPIWYNSTVIEYNSLNQEQVSNKIHLPNWVQSCPLFDRNGNQSYTACNENLPGTINNVAKLFYLIGQVTPEHMYQDIYPKLKEVQVLERYQGETILKSTGFYDIDFFREATTEEINDPANPYGKYKYSPCNEKKQYSFIPANSLSKEDVLAGKEYVATNVYWTPRTFWPIVYPSKYINYGGTEFYQFMKEQGMSLYNDKDGASSEFHSGYSGWSTYNLFSFKGDAWLGSGNTDFTTITYYIRSILNLSGESNEKVNKNPIRVLDLEPCNDFTLTKEKLSEYMNHCSVSRIRLTRMTTAEFVLSQENVLGSYDIVYIGTNRGNMNTLEGLTQYNDSTLNGFIYLHVGDRYHSLNGSRRMPGNDISERKYQELQTYINRGYPVILGNEFYADEEKDMPVIINGIEKVDSHGETIYEKRMVENASLTKMDEAAIDGYMGRLVKENIGKENVYKEIMLLTVTEKEEQITYTSHGVTIVETQVTQAYHTMIDFIHKINETAVCVNGLSIPNATDVLGIENENFQFPFEIKVIGKSQYRAYLFIDYNYNGCFEEEPIYRSNSFSGNVRTSFSAEFSKELVTGACSWKIQVKEESKPNNIFEKIGTTYLQEKEKKVVRICQIMDSSFTFDFATNSQLQEQLESVKDYQFVFTSLSVDEVNKLYDSTPRTAYQWNKDITTEIDGNSVDFIFRDTIIEPFKEEKAGTDRFQNIDILLMNTRGESVMVDGFYDNLESFSKQKKPILFTYGVANDQYRSLFQMNRYEKDRATMPLSDHEYVEKEGYTYTKVLQTELGNLYYPFSTMERIRTKSTDVIEAQNISPIQNYPFLLDDKIGIRNTYSAPYQLNLEVMNIPYYSLSSTPLLIGYRDQGMYSSTPRDGSNNYYLYQYENILYNGIGYQPEATTNEWKLFVNTLVLAANMYQTSGIAPTIEIQDAISIQEDLTSYYLDIDSDYMDITYRNSDIIPLTFRVTDVLLQGEVSIKVNAEDTDYIIYDKNNQEAITFQSGEWYHINYPYSDFQHSNRRNIEIYGISMFRGNKRENCKILSLKERPLFDYD